MVAQYVMVEDASITISIDSPAVLVAGPIAHSLEVSSSGKITVDTKKVAIGSDMSSQNPKTGLAYTNTPYVTPGVLTWDGVLSGFSIATKLKKDGSGVVLDTNGGTVNFNVTTPAINPSPPGSNDPASSYSGTWSINNAGQIKLDVDEG